MRSMYSFGTLRLDIRWIPLRLPRARGAPNLWRDTCDSYGSRKAAIMRLPEATDEPLFMPFPDPDADAPQPMNRPDFLAANAAATGPAAAATSGAALAQPTSEIPVITRELWQWVRIQPVADSRLVWLDAASAMPT